MTPRIGQIVLYKATDRDAQPKPAMIITINGDLADLNVFGAGVIGFERNKKMAASFEEAKGGEWALADRV